MSTCRGGGPEPADRSWRIIDPDGLDIAPCRQIHQLLVMIRLTSPLTFCHASIMFYEGNIHVAYI